MSLNLVPRKLARLGASLRVCDAARAAEDGPVEGENPCSLDELEMSSQYASLDTLQGGALTCSRLSAGPSRDLRPVVAYVRKDRHGVARARIN